MSQNLKSLAMLDIAEIILKESSEPLHIKEIIKKVSEIKEIPEDDYSRAAQLYMDITQSGKFVFCGEEKWDLKERNLELWDKDGYAFDKYEDVEAEEVEEDEEELEFTEFNLEDLEEDEVKEEEDEEELDETLDEEDKKALKEEKAYIEVELPAKSTDDDVEEDPRSEFNDYDEDDYNKIMDDYEDMYDK